MRKIFVPVLLLLIASSAFAGTITSLDPSSIKVNSGEYFITAYGTSPGNKLIFDGPAGHFERDVSATFADRVVGWVPEAIVAKSGTHSLKVRAANGVETNSLNFRASRASAASPRIASKKARKRSSTSTWPTASVRS